jgi:hypothetical protein
LRVVGLRRRSEQNVGFGNRADARTNDAHFDFLGRKFFERSAQNFDRTLNVRFENDEKLFDFRHSERFDSRAL